MQRGGGGRRQDSGHTEGDQGAVEADDKAIVGVDARHQRHGDPAQFHQLPEAVGGDDYLEIVELFAQRLQQQIEAVKQQRAARNLPFAVVTREHCRERELEESLEGKLVIVKASNISPEYRSADYQLGYATGGFGCKPGAGAVRCSLRSSTPGSGAAGTLATSWASLTWTSCRSGPRQKLRSTKKR